MTPTFFDKLLSTQAGTSYVYLLYYVCIDVFTLDARLLARSQYSEGPATYACETWVLLETIESKLMVFERKVLRKIFGPTKERDSTWRIKTNDELDE